MGNTVLTQIVLPAALFTIMLGVGLTLTLADFRRIARAPGLIAAGLGVQLLVLPLLGLLVVWLFQLPPVLAAGLLILTFAPGGATSNMITLLARGDTALSIAMTALASLIAPFSLSLLSMLVLAHWFEDGSAIALPFGPTVLKLALITLLPVLLGLLINHRWPRACVPLHKPVKQLSLLFLLLAVAGIVKANWGQLPQLALQLGPAVLTLVVLAMSAGYLAGQALGATEACRWTLAVEVGIQNAGTALLVTGTILQNAEMSASALLYGVLMNIPAFLLIAYRNRRPPLLAT